ncbi:MAG: (2Fe-2S) ferredoxin domain-containing protein [Kofleriaceae bacterium]|nr:(2Fe-2S) ferredoxin domain-containing protein [Kofleriaceae bacterium]
MTRRHLFVCTNARSSGKPACGRRGGEELLARIQRGLIERRVTDVLVTPCGCLGPCFDGPNAVVYPDAVWYGGLTGDDAPGLVEHLTAGTPYTSKVVSPPGSGGTGDED